MRAISLVAVALLLSACAATYKQEVLLSPRAKLERGKSVLIATPKDGFYETKEYRGSGAKTAIVIQAAFARFSNNVAVSPTCRDLACLQGEGKQTAYAYYAVPEILHWEDRNTEWSGKPDRVEVKLVVYDGATQSEIGSAVISGTSKWATFGGDHPEDLLPEPFQQHINSLY